MSLKALEKQKGLFKEVLSSAASSFFSGASVTGVSLPVRIFEPRSLLERIADWYGYAPLYFQQASVNDDPIERFKLTIAFGLASLNCSITLQKPFNPILGETFQAFFENGTRMYFEHTSHHPPIANFHMQDKEGLYDFYGYYEFKAKISSNTLIMKNEGPNNIKFNDGQMITYNYPTTKLGGMLWGEKSILIEGTMTFTDLKNGLKAVIFFNKLKKQEDIVGKLYKYNPALNLQKKEPNKLSEIKDVQEELAEISGSW
jgi:hypothetical protein